MSQSMSVQQTLDRSELFARYNRRRHDGDAGRWNRALGLAQTTRQPARPYVTTEDNCNCPDRVFRGVVCKHMRALQLARPEQPAPLEEEPEKPDTAAQPETVDDPFADINMFLFGS